MLGFRIWADDTGLAGAMKVEHPMFLGLQFTVVYMQVLACGTWFQVWDSSDLLLIQMQTPNYPEYDILTKIVIVGDHGAGKSSIMMRFAADQFRETHEQTIGVQFQTRIVEVSNRRIKLQIWDTAGAERFRAITLTYYRGAHGILQVFDLTSEKSFSGLRTKLQETRNNSNNNAPIILVGSKCDKGEERVISKQQAEAFAAQEGLEYIQVSARQNINIDEVFQLLCRRIIETRQQPQMIETVHRQPIHRQILNNVVKEEKTNWLHMLGPAALLLVFILLALVSGD